jgi:hypothetical protein
MANTKTLIGKEVYCNEYGYNHATNFLKGTIIPELTVIQREFKLLMDRDFAQDDFDDLVTNGPGKIKKQYSQLVTTEANTNYHPILSKMMVDFAKDSPGADQISKVFVKIQQNIQSYNQKPIVSGSTGMTPWSVSLSDIALENFEFIVRMETLKNRFVIVIDTEDKGELYQSILDLTTAHQKVKTLLEKMFGVRNEVLGLKPIEYAGSLVITEDANGKSEVNDKFFSEIF